MAKGRYFSHAFVLVLALTLSGYASLDRHLPAALSLRLGTVNAEGLVIGEGGEVGSVHLGRLSTIVKPIAIPTSAPTSHAATVYQVRDGEKLSAISARFKVSVDSIRWSNLAALKNVNQDVAVGDRLVIPPVSGVVVTAVDGDTPQALAETYHADAALVVDFNYLRTAAGAPLAAGTQLVIPGGSGPDFEQPAAPSAVARPTTPFAAAPGFSVNPAPAAGPPSATASSPGSAGAVPAAGGNRFAYGYCTWYVYNRRPVPWLGNAWEWFGNAQRSGFATGQSPRSGAIMVTWESGFGHVAYVESVAGDGSWSVSEMNFRGFGVVSSRTIRPGGVPLIGFIY